MEAPSTTYTSMLLWRVLTWLFLCSVIQCISNRPEDIIQFNSGYVEPTIDPSKICQEFPELNDRQQQLCNRHPHATASAMQGLLLAIHECQRQFTGHRWNCSNLDAYISNVHPFTNRGFKESAFVQAMAAASVLHQVASSCSLGKISTCRCKDELANFHSEDEFLWKGCSHDLSFGAKFSRRFLNKKHDGIETIQTMTQTHNSKIGRKAVLNLKSTKCKCHGMSSSCEVKTCWLSAPDLKNVGDKLKSLYEKSVKVDRANSVEGKIIPVRAIDNNKSNQRRRDIKLKKRMVFYENSPTYCEDVQDIGSVGTSGRMCNRTQTEDDVDSCSLLCCGRGFFTVRVHRVEKCDCKFHWCCYVECKKCERDEWVTVCK